MARKISTERRKQIVQIVEEILAENAFKQRKKIHRGLRWLGWFAGWSTLIFFVFFGGVSVCYHLGAPLETGVTMLMVMKWSLIGSLILGGIMGNVWFNEDEMKRRSGRRMT